ncbi:protein arginine kinase [Clostridium botulinum]|uniref:Protein-arginine kinase n=1 Tax=Clostridium botulinum C/D str. DC5 TaxID=1443128 RepID=A0A0A0IQF3_CLOBO|nr:protein arginine kinase [Clostridium botulinum]KGM93897.1 ATP:guanido phosphotransferase [Clostridium botulinum D str. CCUG 7971]KGN01711.1 ATP:guanido phosphotransferase [Clostridium botulinum C/D str. DC5]KOC48859.1 ATP:guanido phosphotransferase [Clostridium botulinum]KOC52583.1 ATP:guanido phosphotransferase [Clostridium botulinum]KOC57961.1 ATP:guanido phosphotransferase [Clostridium botulinum]
MQNWINAKNENSDIVLSSRIRLARNLKKVPFPNKLTVDDAKDIVNKVEEAFYEFPYSKEEFQSIYLWENQKALNEVYLEKHLISKGLIKHAKASAFIVDKSETTSIMINEEDHLRLQTITGGLGFKEAFEYINKIDDFLEGKLDYAFDEKLGYITSCPTNIGTGLRASVMIHLPILTLNKEIVRILNGITQVGMTIRGLYGEGSRAYGNLYQISNQITLGRTEDQILNNLEGIVNQVIEQEHLAREMMLNKHKYELEDKIFRSLGVLKAATILTTREVLGLISNVRLGVEMGIVKDIDKSILNNLLVNIQPSTIEYLAEKELVDIEERAKRAKIVKEALKNVKL